MFRETWEIAVFCVEGGLLAAMAIAFLIARLIAGHFRIMKVRFPIYPVRFVLVLLCAAVLTVLFARSFATYRRSSDHIADMQTRGIIAVAEYENTTVEELLNDASFIDEESYEELYVEIETARFQSIAEDAQRNMTVFGANALVIMLLAVLSGGAYFTRKGVMFFMSFKPVKTTAKIKNGKIHVFINSDYGRALAKFPVTSTNRKNFSGFMIDEIMTED